MAIQTATELPPSLVDDDAIEQALRATLANDHSLARIGRVSGELASRSNLYKSTAKGTDQEGYVADKESLFFEFHIISGEQWSMSTAIGATPAVEDTYTLVGRSNAKSFYPRKNSASERTIIASNGERLAPDADAALKFEYLFNAADGTDSTGTEDLTTVGTVNYAEGIQGLTDTAVDLNGADSSNHLAGTASQTAILGSSDWSLEFLWRPAAGAPIGAILGTTEALPNAWNLFSTTNSIRLVNGSDAFDSTVGGSLAAGVWNYIVLTQTGGTVTLYVDAVLVGAFTGTYSTAPLGTLRLGVSANLADGPDAIIDGLRIWDKVLSIPEMQLQYDSWVDQRSNYAQPATTEIVTHNTSANVLTGKFNPVIMGRLTDGNEPFITTLNSSISPGGTILDLVDPIFADMDPDQNNAQTRKIWITDLTDATQEEIEITSTPSGLTDPTVSALTNGFPAGSLVSDFPYKLTASNLVDDGTLVHYTESAQANLEQSFNESYEGTIVKVVDSAGDNHGDIPFIRCVGQDPAFIQSAVIQKERQDLQGGFENRRLFKEATDNDDNVYSIPRGV